MPPLLILSCDLGFCVCLLHFELLLICLFIDLGIYNKSMIFQFTSMENPIHFFNHFLSVFNFNHCVRVQSALHFLQLWVQSNCEKIPINAKVLGKCAICISQIIFFFSCTCNYSHGKMMNPWCSQVVPWQWTYSHESMINLLEQTTCSNIKTSISMCMNLNTVVE